MTTTLNDHEHKWRLIENHTTTKPILKQEVCDCGHRRFTDVEGKVYYFGGYLGLYGPKASATDNAS